MSRKATLIVLMLITCAACATSPAKIRSNWQPYVGKPVDGLVAAWGPPTRTFDLPAGGGKIYTWLYQGETTISTVDIGLGMTVGSAESSHCKVDWTTDAKGIVQSFRWEGRCKVKKSAPPR